MPGISKTQKSAQIAVQHASVAPTIRASVDSQHVAAARRVSGGMEQGGDVEKTYSETTVWTGCVSKSYD